jgi:hypothetical protein
MAQPDDHSIESTRDEADRLLGELDRKPSSLGTENGFSTPVSDNSDKSFAQMVQRTVPMSWLLLGSLVFGAIVSVLAVALVLQQAERSQPISSTTPKAPDPPSAQKTESKQSNSPTTSVTQPQRDVPTKAQNPEFQAPSPPATGAWGPASVYKFGRIPDSTYPDSCAFSQTDSAGQTIVNRSDVDYWACKDEGGNPTDGFSVSWVDGKRTKYTFGPDGAGLVIGTNGVTHPISWRNDSRNGSNVIVISHSDGATSWIPGRVN